MHIGSITKTKSTGGHSSRSFSMHPFIPLCDYVLQFIGDMDWYFCSFKHIMLEQNYSNFHDFSIIHQISGRVHLVGPSDIFFNSRKCAKTRLSLDWSSSCRRVDGRCSKLSEVGARMRMSGLVSQMWTVLMATTLESVSRQHRMRDRSPHGPPSASCASSSFPQTELIMCGVQACVC